MGTPFIDLQTETQRVAAELTTFHDRLVPAFHGVDPAALRAGASLLLEALSRREPGPAPIGVFAGRLLWSVEVFISVEACGQALAHQGIEETSCVGTSKPVDTQLARIPPERRRALSTANPMAGLERRVTDAVREKRVSP